MADRLPPAPAPAPADALAWTLAEWFTAQQLAGLPGLPGTERRVRASAQKNLWPSRSKERGKGLEYPYAALPAATRRHLDDLRMRYVRAGQAATPDVAAALTPSPHPRPLSQGERGEIVVRTPRALPARPALTDLDRARRDALAILCRAVEVESMDAGVTIQRACERLALRLARRECDAPVQTAAETAYIKPRGSLYLGGAAATASRLARHMLAFKRGAMEGDLTRYLVPGRPRKQAPDSRLLGIFLRAWCRPSRPPIAQVLREIKPTLLQSGLHVPSYSAASRLVALLPVTIKHRGRMTGSEFKSLLPYIERDASQLRSNDVWVGDGHSFKAKVRHPVHGQPFTPEITFIIDWASRKIVGWSIDLAESTLAVSAAFRHAQQCTRARPLVYYSDNGSGQTGKLLDHDITGTLTRQGIAHHTGIPGNPQARGIIERVWDITLIRLAKTYATCTHRGNDDLTTNRMLKALAKKDFGGVQVPDFGQLLMDVKASVDDYNLHHRHSSLKGKSPEEVYQAKLDESSIQLGPNDAELAALWMPETLRVPQRGSVSVFNGRYTFGDLVHLIPEGEKVRVRFDIHDSRAVWLYTLAGEYLGEARFDSHKQETFAGSYLDQQRAKRAKGLMKKAEAQIARAQAELPSTVEGEFSVTWDIPQASPETLPVAEDVEEVASPAMSHEDAVMWLYGGEEEPADEERPPDFEVAAG